MVHVYPGPLVAQMRRGTLQYCILALLSTEERYGFDLVRALGAVDGMVTSEGTIYPLLGRLPSRRAGRVELARSRAGPPRRYYRLTRRAGPRSKAFVVEWGRFRDGVDHFLERKARA